MAEKSKRGGARPGSGRPRLSKKGLAVTLTVTVTPEAMQAVERHMKQEGCSKSAAVNSMLLKL